MGKMKKNSSIKALPQTVWTRIAAGEVVERPASAVKELVENSLDAGAKFVKVKLWDGGRLRIIVEDDGSGISFDELPLALTYHATSKISNLEDLENIDTLGYRGEALASLVAVADVEIRSKTQDSDFGGLIRASDGKITEHVKANCPSGTRVQIENLFGSLPARRKFLKSASGELRRSAIYLREYSVCRPEIAFLLEHDGKKIFNTDGAGDRKRILAKFWGSGSEIQNVIVKTEHLKLECWLQQKNGIQSGRSEIMAFVNNRAVNDPVIKGAVSSAARELTGNWALFFSLEPSLVDVNIHPAKAEVRFRYPGEIFESLKKASDNLGKPQPVIKNNGWDFNDSQELKVKKIQIPFRNNSNITKNSDYFNNISNKKINIDYKNDKKDFFEENEKTFNDFKFENDFKPEIKYMGQNYVGYLIFDTFDGLIIMDPHAAHERINYERIKTSAENSQNVQKLLIPILLHPTLALEAHEYRDKLQSAGFEFEESSNGMILKSVPSISVEIEIEPEVLLRGSLGALKSENDGDIKEILWRTWATMACKASVKLTTKLSDEEALKLWNDVHKCVQPFLCPHGRPTILKITNQDFAKHFGRD